MFLLLFDEFFEHIRYEIDLKIVILLFCLDTELDHVHVLVENLYFLLWNELARVFVIPNEFIFSEVKSVLLGRVS